MSLFDNQDPFESIISELFGKSSSTNRQSNSNGFIQGEEDERRIDLVEVNKKVFLIFEIPGYSKEDIIVKVSKRNIEIIAKKRNFEGVQTYLAKKLNKGVYINKNLPSFISSKKFNYTFKNGILEVVFDKK